MLRLFSKLLFVGMIIGGAALYMRYGGDIGQIIENLKNLQAQNGGSATGGSTASAGSGSSGTIYRWQDSTGHWHVSDKPPPEGTEYSSTKYNLSTNSMAAPPKEKQPEEPATAAAAPALDPNSFNPATIYTDPTAVKQLIDEAQRVKGMMESRQNFLDDKIDTNVQR